MICPCKDCTFETGRTLSCHDTCEKYKSCLAEYHRQKAQHEQDMKDLNEIIRQYDRITPKRRKY